MNYTLHLGDCLESLRGMVLTVCCTIQLISKQPNCSMKFISDLHNGRIGEHLAAADIMMHGYECFQSAQGMPYDLIADIGGLLKKVQVKTTQSVRSVPQRVEHIPAHLFWINRCGKGGKACYPPGEIDLFALVSLEEKSVGYIAAGKLPRTFFVRSEKFRGQYNDEVLAKRNQEVLASINAGVAIKDVCKNTGLDKSYVHRLLNGKGYLTGAGIYMRDLTLEQALRGAANA